MHEVVIGDSSLHQGVTRKSKFYQTRNGRIDCNLRDGECMYVWGVCVALSLLGAHLRNGTGRRTVTLMAPLLLTSGLARYEAALHSCGTSPVGG